MWDPPFRRGLSLGMESLTSVPHRRFPGDKSPGKVIPNDKSPEKAPNWVKLVIKADNDRKIKFCCLQSEAAEPYMRICGVDREDVLRRFLFIEGPDAYHQGFTG
nr:hypothetical protein [Tanacetum cinerariifolium]